MTRDCYESQDTIWRHGPESLERRLPVDSPRTVLLKRVTNPEQAPREAAQLQAEWEESRSLDCTGTVPVLEYRREASADVLVLEDVGGTSLLTVLENGPPGLDEVLSIACALTKAVCSLHEAGRTHQAIEPRHFLYDRAKETAWLTGLGMATTIRADRPVLHATTWCDRFLAYMSPEQTGRMNCPVDRRTDLYSIGIVLFELLVGRVPFVASDPPSIIHAHIAQQPPTVSELRKNTPEALSAVIARLLAKSPDDRYQTSAGVLHDLELIAEACSRSGMSQDFALGTEDKSGQLQFPSNIYGRQSELHDLHQAYGRVREGDTEFLLVAGYPGIGKTALVRELQRDASERRGYFISGKQDLTQRSIPYSAFTAALDEFCTYLLSLNNASLGSWRIAILEALGENGQVLLDLVPRYELVIGPQPLIEDIESDAARNRFHAVFVSFIKVLSRLSRPLIIFLDDLQWADTALLDLLVTISQDTERTNLLLIGAYRANETDDGHPLTLAVSEIRKTRPVQVLTLESLPQLPFTRFVADTLCTTAQRVSTLSNLLRKKTGGNAFFVKQFMELLHQDGLLFFDHEKSQWDWSLDQIRSKDYSLSVVELIAKNIREASAMTRTALIAASCIGGRFDLSVLSDATERPWQDLRKSLTPAIEAGMVIPSSKTPDKTGITTGQDPTSIVYDFVHDRVQEAAYSLITVDERPQVHLQIARSLLRSTSRDETDPRLFELASHLNKAASLITSPKERLIAARIHERAGNKALRSTAYREAGEFYRNGLAFVSARDSRSQPCDPLVHQLNMGLARCQFMDGKFASTLAILGERLPQTTGRDQRVEILRLKSATETQVADLRAARDTMLMALEEIEIHVDEDEASYNKQLKAELQDADLPDSALAIRAVSELHESDDLAHGESVDLLVNAYIPLMQFQDRKTADLLALRAVKLSLHHGAVPSTGMACVYHGVFLSHSTQAYEQAFLWGQAGMRLAERHRDGHYRTRTLFTHCLWLSHFGSPARETTELYSKVYELAVDSGDFMYAGFAVANRTITAMLCGYRVEELIALTREQRLLAKRVNYVDEELLFESVEHAIQAMAEGSAGASKWSCDGFDEEAHWLRIDNELMILNVWIVPVKLMLLIVDCRYGEARQLAHHVESVIQILPTCYHALSIRFYQSLATLLDVGNGEVSARELEHVSQLIEELAHRSDACEINFGHQHNLLQAITADAEDRVGDAMDFFDAAIASAKKSQYLNVEALANDLAAQFWLNRKRPRFALPYLHDAWECYDRWGLRQRAEDLLSRIHVLDSALGSNAVHASESHQRTDTADLLSVVKAARIISSELEPEELMPHLARILSQAVGAQRAVLVLPKREDLSVAAIYDINTMGKPHPKAQDVSLGSLVPTSLVRYVFRIGETVQLGEAATEGAFVTDPYFSAQQTRSALCVPLRRGDRTLGVFYFENNLATHSFAPKRERALDLLLNQAAISLETAFLFRKQREGEEALAEAQRIAQVGSFEGDLTRGELRWSLECYRLHGKDPASYTPTKEAFAALLHPDDRQEYLAKLEHSLSSGTPLDANYRVANTSGDYRLLHTLARVNLSKRGEVIGLRGTVQDITKAQHSRDQLTRTAALLRNVLDSSPDQVFVKDLKMRMLMCNESFAQAYNRRPHDFIGKTDAENGWSARSIHGNPETGIKGYELDDLEALGGAHVHNPDDRATLDGVTRVFDTHKLPLRDSEGEIFGVLCVARDITEHKIAKQRLEDSEANLNEAQRIAHTGHWIWDPNSGALFWSEELLRIFGHELSFEPSYESFMAALHQKDREMVVHAIEDALADIKPYSVDVRIVLPSGALRHVFIRGEVSFDKEGAPTLMRGTVQDITNRKRVEQEREDLLAQLRQAQKMESVGRLAGGIAHDFNNLLTVINGYAELAATDLPANDPMIVNLDAIMTAGQRAGTLTRQLLAFSRKQVLEPTILDLNVVVSRVEQMLRRLIGEDVELHTVLAEDLGRVSADRGQIEQVLMNLVVNARDAMPTGGKITIESANVDLDEAFVSEHADTLPGPYVMLSVIDDGIGMDQETMTHLFEPFFTTKGLGEGTGLGLAMVYGIVKQSRGSIEVISEPKSGTTVTFYLPGVEAEISSQDTQSAKSDTLGSETILVVEDEEAVRSLAQTVLRSAGYNIITAANGREAVLEFERKRGLIDLLLTDVVMPKQSGKELATKLTARYPALKILFMSGYTDDALMHHGLQNESVSFLAKPFSATELTNKVRMVLESHRRTVRNDTDQQEVNDQS